MERYAMGSLSIRNVDDDLIARLKRRAARHGNSAEAEVRDILRQTLAAEQEPSFEQLAAELRALTRDRKHTPAEQLLRESRDEH
jgi:plasmid stability protein